MSPGPIAPGKWASAAVFSFRMSRIPHLASLVGAQRVLWWPLAARASEVDAVIGWGAKSNTVRARSFARRHGIAYWRAEDGFLRSVGLGVQGEPPLSVVLDDRGVYYDARTESRLEAILADRICSGVLDDRRLVKRARRAIDRIVEHQLSKYNNSPPGPVDLGPRPAAGRVLVVDQTCGDLSVRYGLASEKTFATMLEAALSENPGAEVLVKVHPDVVAGNKRGYLNTAAGRERVRVIGEPLNPLALLEAVDRVYVVTSQLGFEALMVGKPVTCFGAPFYAGWGLTEDRVTVPRRSVSRTIEQVFAAAYILYARYIDPDDGDPCELERVIEHLVLQRQQFARNRGVIYCFGFRFWKRAHVRSYLRCPGNRVVFARDAGHAERLGFRRGENLLVWGQRDTPELRSLAGAYGATLWRMEDGFLRSVGLGSDLVAPASLVLDRQGIYYDPTQPSDLETTLQQAEFSEAECSRAAQLRRRIVGTGVSKYNVGESVDLQVPAGRRVVLVPGQVEDDSSIQLGCRDVATNLGLLRAVRADRPDAFIIYKPHPDVLSGNRRGVVELRQALVFCDQIEQQASLAQCLAVASEVHTMTSLVGFEALLRGLEVFVYGQPFYAGWGLTHDQHPIVRRTRRLTLDQLVAGTLLRYPRYLSASRGEFTTPEAVISQLCRQRAAGPGAAKVQVVWPRRQLRKLVQIYKGVADAR